MGVPEVKDDGAVIHEMGGAGADPVALYVNEMSVNGVNGVNGVNTVNTVNSVNTMNSVNTVNSVNNVNGVNSMNTVNNGDEALNQFCKFVLSLPIMLS